MKSRRAKSTSLASIIVVLILVGVYYLVSHPELFKRTQASQTELTHSTNNGSGGSVTGEPGALPNLAVKPRPVVRSFKGCPPEGDGGDPALNQLKNRVDEANYYPVQFDSILKLSWPQGAEEKHRSKWTARDGAEVARYEGIPIAVEGYLANVKEEGPESPNCHGAGHEFRDYHIWFTKSPDDDRSSSIVVEATPPIRSDHPGWRLNVFRQIVNEKSRVRISGWLMFDPEHPDQVGKTRGTIWEIHPIMQVEVQQRGQWITLDDWAITHPTK